jgi:sensor histidine kinase YesM
MVPPLILQPLIENALRHGIGRRTGPGVIRIGATRVGAHLELSVHDTGEGLGLVEGGAPREGIGLSNIRARLAELYGAGAATLELLDEPGGGACARMLIPFHSARESLAVARGA